MLCPQTEDEQKTVKRCYQTLKNLKNHSRNHSSPSQTPYQTKIPLDSLFYDPFINTQDPTNNFEISQNFIRFQTPSEPQKSLNLNDLTFVLQESKNPKTSNLSNCCARLFTFMQSTQKERLLDQNKENQFNGNLLNVQENSKKSLKNNKYDFPLKYNPKPEGSTKFLKKIEYRQKYQEKPLNDEQNLKNPRENELLNFIEGSRKKREELLIQLEQLDLDQLESLCPENIKYLTPREKMVKKETPKIRVDSSRNSTNGNKKFFRKLLVANDRKSPRVVMKESLRERHFSVKSMSNAKSTFSPKEVQTISREKSRGSLLNGKRQDKLLRQKGVELKSKIRETKKSEEKIILHVENGKTKSRKLSKAKQSNGIEHKFLKGSVSQRGSERRKDLHVFEDESEKRRMQELLRKKKELERELTNIKEDLVLFNKKKKKNAKDLK